MIPFAGMDIIIAAIAVIIAIVIYNKYDKWKVKKDHEQFPREILEPVDLDKIKDSTNDEISKEKYDEILKLDSTFFKSIDIDSEPESNYDSFIIARAKLIQDDEYHSLMDHIDLLAKSIKENDLLYSCLSLHEIGNIYNQRAEYDIAIMFHDKATKIYKLLKFKRGEFDQYIAIARNYSKLDKRELSEQYKKFASDLLNQSEKPKSS